MANQKESKSPFRIIIFGSDGDLSYRKIFPALYHRMNDEQISEEVQIMAASRTPRSQEEYIETLASYMDQYIKDANQEVLNQLYNATTHFCFKGDEAVVKKGMQEWFKGSEEHVRVFYLATPASAFGPISDMLLRYDLINEYSRIVL